MSDFPSVDELLTREHLRAELALEVAGCGRSPRTWRTGWPSGWGPASLDDRHPGGVDHPPL